jgi:imidazolonepropionase-like amidohydrolase
MKLWWGHPWHVPVSGSPGIIYASVYEGAEFGIDRAQAEKMGSVAALEGMAEVDPEIRKRGIRGPARRDYGFPNNPIGRNARDLEHFTGVLGYQPLEALTAATKIGGQLMGMGDELGVLAPGYLADALVVTGNPVDDLRLLQDPANLANIIQGGQFYKSPDGR